MTRVHNGEEEILLSIKKDPGYGQGAYTLPGGKLRENESLEACATRELFEETNLRLLASQPLPNIHSRPDADKPDRVVRFVAAVALAWDGVLLNKEPETHAEWQWFSVNALPSPLMATIPFAVDQYRSRNLRDLDWEELEARLRDSHDS